MTELEQLKTIVEDAPDGATHYATHYAAKRQNIQIRLYYKWIGLDQYETWKEKESCWSDKYRPIDHIHSLSDIKRIIELLGQ